MKDCFYLLEFSKILSVFVFLIIYLSAAYVLWCFFLSSEIRVCSIFSGAGKFYLARGLRQLTRNIKVTSVVYKCSLRIVKKNAE